MASWLASDAVGVAVAGLVLPRALLGVKRVEDDPEAWLEIAVVAMLSVRSMIWYLALPGHAGACRKRPEALVAFVQTVVAHLIVGTVGIHVALVLFGAPFVELFKRTALLAIWLSELSMLSVAFASTSFAGPPSQTAKTIAGRVIDDFAVVVLFKKPDDQTLVEYQGVDLYLRCQAIGSLFGAWLGAFPIPLDWDRPWQAWPVTCVYGSLFGFLIGCIIGFGLDRMSSKVKSS